MNSEAASFPRDGDGLRYLSCHREVSPEAACDLEDDQRLKDFVMMDLLVAEYQVVLVSVA
jgi:hypothetical protein